jgi:hypothetical protein
MVVAEIHHESPAGDAEAITAARVTSRRQSER